MKILVTGGAGFIGSHLVDALIKKNYEVIVIDNLSSGKVSNINKFAIFFNEDLKNFNKIDDIFKDNEIEAIYHLSAQVSVVNSINDPINDANENIINTLNLIQLCKKYNVKKFICASSAAVYGNCNKLPIIEEEKLKPISPYGISKLAMEFYVENSGLDYLIFRFSNVYGPRQHPEKFVPMCIKKIQKGDKVFIHSDESRTIPGSRFYIHSRDVASAVHFIMTTNTTETKLNIVGKEEVTNLQVAQYIAAALQKTLNYEFVDFHSSRPGHDLRYALSGKRLEALGWKPEISMKECLPSLVKEYIV